VKNEKVELEWTGDVITVVVANEPFAEEVGP
jgi:hypothetical protein